MNESEDTRLTSISKARTLDEIADFWDTHSLADYWDQTHEVEFEVRAKRRHRVTLARSYTRALRYRPEYVGSCQRHWSISGWRRDCR